MTTLDRHLMHIIRNKVDIIAGCGKAIDAEPRNTADARHKGRIIIRATEQMLEEIQELLQAEGVERK